MAHGGLLRGPSRLQFQWNSLWRKRRSIPALSQSHSLWRLDCRQWECCKNNVGYLLGDLVMSGGFMFRPFREQAIQEWWYIHVYKAFIRFLMMKKNLIGNYSATSTCNHSPCSKLNWPIPIFVCPDHCQDIQKDDPEIYGVAKFWSRDYV